MNSLLNEVESSHPILQDSSWKKSCKIHRMAWLHFTKYVRNGVPSLFCMLSSLLCVVKMSVARASHSKNLEQICRPVSVCASRKQITVALLERVLRSLWIYDLLVLKRNICLAYGSWFSLALYSTRWSCNPV